MSGNTIFENKKTFKSIASKLFFAFLAVSASILLIETAITIYFDFQRQQQIIYREQQFIAQSAAGVVREYVLARVRTLNDTLVVGNIENHSVLEQKIILNRLLKTNTSFRQIAIFNNKGQMVTNASQLSSLLFDDFSKHVDAELFSDFQKKGHLSHVSNVYIDKETNEPLVTLAVPIKDVFGDFKGAIVAEVNLKFMWDLVANLEVGEQGTAYVVDQNGYLLAFENTSRVLHRENLRSLIEVHEFINNIHSGHDQTAENGTGINGTAVVSTYALVADEPQWAVVVEQPVVEAYKFIIQQLITSGLILIASLILITIMSSIVAKKITKPIIQLRDGAKQISAGNLHTEIPVSSHDEIGELATTFNQMTKQLEESYASLEKRIQEKTTELAKKIGETERINRFMLGRELKMVELKKEIDSLKKTLADKDQTEDKNKETI